EQRQAANMTEHKRMSMSRKHSIKSLMLQVARDLLEAEAEEKVKERKTYMDEHCPPLCLPSSRDGLQALCKELHEKIIVIDEERYNLEVKANMVVDEVKDLSIKIVDLKGKFKKPPLKKVRMSADAMLQALLGSKHKVNLDLRANLKQVKKEVKEESLMLSIAKGLLEAEAIAAEATRAAYMEETCPELSFPGSMADLQELVKKLHAKIDKIDEERYDLESKVTKSNKEIDDLKIKVQDLQGKFKKPALKKVRMSADSMLQALLGSKHKVNLDLRANLKQVKKEVKEEVGIKAGFKMVNSAAETLKKTSGKDMKTPEQVSEKMRRETLTSIGQIRNYRKKMTSSRRHALKSLMLAIAKGLLEKEIKQSAADKIAHMTQNCSEPSYPHSVQELQELCKKLHHDIDRVDEERYDLEAKIAKGDKEIEDLKIKVIDLKGKFKKPTLRKVRMSADQMLQALLGSKHKVSLDLRANLKQVKKEVKEEEKVDIQPQSLLLSIAAGLLEAEAKQLVEDKESYINEHCPSLSLPSSVQELQELCKKLQQNIDTVDEERYDLEAKVTKGDKEIEDLKIKVVDLKGKFKKPVLRKVRMSADQMLQALLGSKHKVSLDLRANLKQVKKEVKEE
ncbi:troponin I, fast skeletal muscle-like, partial [Clarias magur]